MIGLFWNLFWFVAAKASHGVLLRYGWMCVLDKPSLNSSSAQSLPAALKRAPFLRLFERASQPRSTAGQPVIVRGTSDGASTPPATPPDVDGPVLQARTIRLCAPLGLFSNIWLWRGVAGVLTAAVILILCIQFVNRSSAKDFPVCPSLELCPSGWLYFQRKCYYLSESEANWNSSQSLCSSHNASLLVIENDQELSFMVKITKQDPWIGLYKRNEEFFWVNGKALDNKLIEVKGSGNCAYLESKGVSASGCYLTRKWVCSLNISLAQ
ncbi:C-type lectin domain family 2 member L-like isoform X2 [Accipiter gentilis]|uniref:C-type lectin domain family 2 member L-like isoform X2 n=1 Tax=Astur gentilis TaxID=8957 RepID=UPI0021100C6C|nr:C-type lectin domain family 2 member L-like isoform X2 [Accipiter gentilis]